jgi:hypothetical protein
MRVSALAALTIISALVVFATWPQAARLGTAVTDFGDPLLNAWILAWVAHAIVHDPLHLFNTNIFFPEQNTLAYSETLIVPAILAAPLLWGGVDPMFVQNLWVLLGYALSGLATFLLVRELTGHEGAALVSGVVFALYPYRIDQYPHVQSQMTFWLPLALFIVARMRRAPSLRLGLWLGVVIAAEMYSCVYYGIYGPIVIAVIAAAAVVTAERPHRATILRSLSLAAVVAALCIAPLLKPYLAASRVVGTRSIQEVASGSARPSDYLHANPDNAMHGDDRRPGIGEHRLFPGYVAPVLAVAAMVPPFSPLTFGYLAGAATTFDLSLGLNGVGYRWLYDWVPGFHALRIPARLGMFFGLTLAVLAGFGVARAVRARRALVQTTFVIVTIGLVTLESRSRPLDLSHLADQSPAVYSWLAQQPPAVVCEYPVGNLQGRAGPQDATYMYYSTRHWQRLVNGYSGFTPPSYNDLLEHLRDFPSEASIAYLHQRGVTILLVHSAFYIRGDFDSDVRALKGRADVEWVATFAFKGRHTTEVFRIR